MSALTAQKSPTAAANLLRRVVRARETGIVIALIVVIVAATAINPAFLFSTDGWRNLLLTPTIAILLAVGEAIVIITRSVDLSVGSVVGVTAYLTGQLFIAIPGLPIIVVFVAGLVVGGHPFGMTGARIATTLINSLQFHDKTIGLETMCVGGGQGMAMIFERLS